MKNLIFTFSFIFIATCLISQTEKIKIVLNYSLSRSLLNLDGPNAKSISHSGQLGLRYQLNDSWDLHFGARYMLTGYHTEVKAILHHEFGGTSSVVSSIEYRNWGFPLGAGYSPLKNFRFQFSVIPTLYRNTLTKFFEEENSYNEKYYRIETATGFPKQLSLFLGISAEYAFAMSEKWDLSISLRAISSGIGILENETTITRLSDFGGSIGLVYILGRLNE